VAASVEIDGRNGRAVRVNLMHPGFRDAECVREMSNEVYVAESIPQQPVHRGTLPKPGTDDVANGFRSWLALCRTLGLDPGNQTNITNVNWDVVFIYTNKMISPSIPVAKVTLSNDVVFQMFDGVAISHFAGDAFFTGFWDRKPKSVWSPLMGHITRNWEDLAKEFETTLTTRLGIPQELVRRFRPRPVTVPPKVGTEALRRIAVEWRPVSAQREQESSIPTRFSFSAEFDLITGELKFITIEDPKMIEYLRHVES
jgi:hypothetical protein